MTIPSMFAILGVWAAIAAIAWKHAENIKQLCVAAVFATFFIAWMDAEASSASPGGLISVNTRSCPQSNPAQAPGETAPSR